MTHKGARDFSTRLGLAICISSIRNPIGTTIEFSLSNAEQRDSWLNSGHRTLAADTRT